MIDYLEEMDPKYLDEPEEEQATIPKGKARLKPKSEKVLVPFRPHRDAKSVQRWKAGRCRSEVLAIDGYYVQEGVLSMSPHTGFGLAEENEFRVPLDWRGPVPEWGKWLVPVVTGGPWYDGRGSSWELWKDGRRLCSANYYKVCEDLRFIAAYNESNSERPCTHASATPGVFLHAPRGWTDPVPEGCCLPDERVPVERVSRGVMEGFTDGAEQRCVQSGASLVILYPTHTHSWYEDWAWEGVTKLGYAVNARYAFLLDTNTHDHGPLDEERFFWAAGSEPKGKVVASQTASKDDRPCDARNPLDRVRGSIHALKETVGSLEKALEKMKEENWGPRK
jgi:hypothetical protein